MSKACELSTNTHLEAAPLNAVTQLLLHLFVLLLQTPFSLAWVDLDAQNLPPRIGIQRFKGVRLQAVVEDVPEADIGRDM